MHLLFYWLARLALMFAVFVALWGFGWRPWLAVAGAVVISWLISYSMFGSMHDSAARQMEGWASRRFGGVVGDEDAEAEPTIEPKAAATLKRGVKVASAARRPR